MPLEVRRYHKENFLDSHCEVPKCLRMAGKRILFMDHELGRYCQTCAKEMVETWERGGRAKSEC